MKVTDIDRQGRINLSEKQYLQMWSKFKQVIAAFLIQNMQRGEQIWIAG